MILHKQSYKVLCEYIEKAQCLNFEESCELELDWCGKATYRSCISFTTFEMKPKTKDRRES